MNDLLSFWETTKERFDGLEKALIECYIGFLREVASIGDKDLFEKDIGKIRYQG
ncbi:MAG: hypothetical protein HY786_06835 [Deltaproteobacteria bacterium]|nr:hypothetical protein [Deltaproteobacteria bacterium]